jgi:hypothetical protein
MQKGIVKIQKQIDCCQKNTTSQTVNYE